MQYEPRSIRVPEILIVVVIVAILWAVGAPAAEMPKLPPVGTKPMTPPVGGHIAPMPPVGATPSTLPPAPDATVPPPGTLPPTAPPTR
jgi:hypothetical protein